MRNMEVNPTSAPAWKDFPWQSTRRQTQMHSFPELWRRRWESQANFQGRVFILQKWKHVPIQRLRHNVHNSFIHNNQKLETTQLSVNRWMNKYIVIHSCNKILLSSKEMNYWYIHRAQNNYANILPLVVSLVIFCSLV